MHMHASTPLAERTTPGRALPATGPNTSELTTTLTEISERAIPDIITPHITRD